MKMRFLHVFSLFSLAVFLCQCRPSKPSSSNTSTRDLPESGLSAIPVLESPTTCVKAYQLTRYGGDRWDFFCRFEPEQKIVHAHRPGDACLKYRQDIARRIYPSRYRYVALTDEKDGAVKTVDCHEWSVEWSVTKPISLLLPELKRQERWLNPAYNLWAGKINSLQIPPNHKLLVCNEVTHEQNGVPACKGKQKEFVGHVPDLAEWNDSIKYIELIDLPSQRKASPHK